MWLWWLRVQFPLFIFFQKWNNIYCFTLTKRMIAYKIMCFLKKLLNKLVDFCIFLMFYIVGNAPLFFATWLFAITLLSYIARGIEDELSSPGPNAIKDLVFLVKTGRYLSLAEIVIFIAYEFLKWAVMFLNDCIFLAEEKEYWLLAEMIRKVCEKLLKWCIKHYFGLLKEFIELFFQR